MPCRRQIRPKWRLRLRLETAAERTPSASTLSKHVEVLRRVYSTEIELEVEGERPFPEILATLAAT